MRESFRNFPVALAHFCARTKASCILNGASNPGLKDSLVYDMKYFAYSLATDVSNDEHFKKMNHLQ